MSATPVWLEVDSVPPVALYRENYTRKLMTIGKAYPILQSVGTLHRPLSVPGMSSGENANFSVSLDNASGVVTSLWAADPPLRTPARLMCPDGVLFSGVVTNMTLSSEASITIEGGLLHPLTDKVPLRTSAVWGSYKDLEALPYVYGRVTLSPIQYDQEGYFWLLADHAIRSVVKVTRDDAPIKDWQMTNMLDSVGHLVSILELATPLAAGERLAVTVMGKMHPSDGRVLTEPADVLWDFLSNVCGLPLSKSDMDSFRVEAQAIALHGMIKNTDLTIRGQIDEIIQSCGGAWSAGMKSFATLYPAKDTGDQPSIGVYAPLTMKDLTADANHENIVTVLRVLYDWDHSEDRFRRALQLEAPESVARYGIRIAEWEAPWLSSPRLAAELGERILTWSASPRWEVSWTTEMKNLSPGDWVEINHPQSPVSGRHRLVLADLDTSKVEMMLSVISPVLGTVPIEITKLSTAFEPVIQAGASVVYQDGKATFTIQDDTGEAMAGATVTLDNKDKRITDSAGRVQFTTPRGKHFLRIEAVGYSTMEMEITL